MKKAGQISAVALAAVLVMGSRVIFPPASNAAGNAQTDNNIKADLQN